MTKIKLTSGLIISAESVELVDGIFKIVTTQYTVEELIEIFSNKENLSLITLMTESEIETGIKTGFTSFAGINYDAETGFKTVELFQPRDVTEARLSNVEALVNSTSTKVNNVEEQNNELSATMDSILTEILPTLMEV